MERRRSKLANKNRNSNLNGHAFARGFFAYGTSPTPENTPRGAELKTWTPHAGLGQIAGLNAMDLHPDSSQKIAIALAPRSTDLLHQQHLPRTLNRAVQPPLVVRRQSRVLAWQNPTLVGDKLFQEVGILEIKRFHGEIDLWFGTRRSRLSHGPTTGAAFLTFLRTSLTRHKALLNLLV